MNNNNTETKDEINSSGVYKINCEGCDTVYIGETGSDDGITFENVLVWKHSKIVESILIT